MRDELRRLIHLVRHDEVNTRGDIVRRVVIRLVYGITGTVSGVILSRFVTPKAPSIRLLVFGCVLTLLIIVQGVVFDRRRLEGGDLWPAKVFVWVSTFVVVTAAFVIMVIRR